MIKTSVEVNHTFEEARKLYTDLGEVMEMWNVQRKIIDYDDKFNDHTSISFNPYSRSMDIIENELANVFNKLITQYVTTDSKEDNE